MRLFSRHTIKSQFLVLIVFLVLGFTVQGQTPPDTVAAVFKTAYPDASRIKWSETELKGKEYKVSFTSGKEKMTAYYDVSGKHIETDKPIDPALLPEPVIKTMEIQYGKYAIEECYIIDRNGTADLYEIEFTADGNTSTVTISKDGYFTAR